MAGFRKDTTTQPANTQTTQVEQAKQQTAFVDQPLSQPPLSVEDEPEVPLEVNEPVEVDSLVDQESNLLPAAERVLLRVKKASIKTMLIDNKLKEGERLDSTTLDINKWTTKALHLELSLVDGINGKNINRVVFCDLYLKINMVALKEAYARKKLAAQIQGRKMDKEFNEEFWEKQSRYQTKLFYVAIGFDLAQPVPPADDQFLIQLIGCEVLGDITRVADNYRGQGEFKNEVRNFRSYQ